MTAKELYQILKSGTQPVIQISDDSNLFEDFELNYGCFTKALRVDDFDTDPDDGRMIYHFVFDEASFRETNKSLLSTDWYVRGMKRGTYIDAGMTNSEGTISLWVEEDVDFFELVDGSPLYDYMKSGSPLSYIQWLESYYNKMKELYG